MRATVKLESFKPAFAAAASATPDGKTPMPILDGVLMVVGDDSRLVGTDLEASLSHAIEVHSAEPGAVVLPADPIRKAISACSADAIAFEEEGGTLTVRAGFSEFEFQVPDAMTFPATGGFDASSYHVLEARDLRRLIRRTYWCTDKNSTRYALAGVLVEWKGDAMSFVGADGRRLSKQVVPCGREGSPATGRPVLPPGTLKMIERHLSDEDPPVHVAFTENAATFRTGKSVVWTRMVEGRFPSYEQILPASATHVIPIKAGDLKGAVQAATVVTDDLTRGVDFRFSPGSLRLTSAAERGKARVGVPVEFDGTTEVRMDPKYLTPALDALDDAMTVTVELGHRRQSVMFRADGGDYLFVLSPMDPQE